MPVMPPKPCSSPRCNKMASKGGRCDDHQPEPWNSSKSKTPTERGYGYDWVKIRLKALLRDGHLCQECMKNGIITLATDVDHIISKAKGGTNRLDNLQSLCNPCHKAKTIKERNSEL